MTPNPCPQNIWNHASGCVCASNGTITAEVDLDLDAFASEAKDTADRLRRDADAHLALSQRIEVYALLKDYPADYSIETMLWPEDANDDGTFDVNLRGVLNADGDVVEDFEGEPGGIPAGWFDENDKPRSAFDVWRKDSDPDSPIQMGRVHAWFKDYQAYRAAEGLESSPAVQRATHEIRDIFEAIKASPASDANGRTRTFGGTDVGVSLYATKDADGFTKPRGAVGDVTLTGRGKHLTFPFGQPFDSDNHDTYEAAEAAAAQVLADWNG